jgi:phosphatidate cytidylyltransferase
VGATGGAPEPPPSLAEVEAMAESLAREFRSSPEEGIEVLADVERPSGAVAATAGPPGGAGPRAASRPTERPEMPPFDDDMLGEFEAPEPPTPAPRSTPRTVKVGAPEDLTGPSWEDPSARTVTRERPPAPRRPGDRDLPLAVTTGAALVALALLALAIKPFAFAVVVAIVIMIGQAEFYAATQRQGYHPATLLGLVAGAMIVAGAYYRGESGILLMVILAVVATFLWFMATPVRLRTDVIANAGVTIFGLVYIPVMGSFYVVLLTATGSRALVIAVLGLTFLYDVAAFFIGRYWGRRPLASTISPKKSWEGLVGATFVTVLVASVLPRSFGPLRSELKLFGLGVVIVLMAPLGDLVESMLKRDLGIKDMGSILPGHGGMLDRVDSALLVAPAVYYFLRLVS